MIQSLEGLKIVSAKELQRIEKESVDEGMSEKEYILKASKGLADTIVKLQNSKGFNKNIVLLAGKGNNGADGYATAALLIKEGFNVKTFYLYEDKECSYLNRFFKKQYIEQGGECFFFSSKADFTLHDRGCIIDALVGAGFSGETQGSLADVIKMANESRLPILALDIPSGLDGTTGMASLHTIKATVTLCLGPPKTGFFIQDGYNKVGEIHYVDFGLPAKNLSRALGFGYLLNESAISALLSPIEKTQHKYERGYVVAFAGTRGMGGAALLSTLAAFRSGAGIVRLFHQEGLEFPSQHMYAEIIKESWVNSEVIIKELSRASSVLIGPGMSALSDQEEKQMIALIENMKTPLIVDAEMIQLFRGKLKCWPQQTILTPHRAEAKKLLGITGVIKDEDLFEKCQGFVEDTKVVLILKGAPTIIFESKKPLLIVARGDPGMAAAGSGDVLSGVIASALSRKLSAKQAAAFAVYFHAQAGEIAALHKTSYSLMSHDLIEAFPLVFKNMLN